MVNQIHDFEMNSVGGYMLSHKEARLEGYEEGFNEGKSQYCIAFPCNVCGQEIEITNEDTKQAVRGYMVEHKW